MFERISSAMHLQNMSLLALVDVLVVAIIIYNLLLLIRGTRSVHMLVAMGAMVLFYFLTGPGLFHLSAFHSLLGYALLFLPIAVIVLFQHQMRQALANLGRNPLSALIPKRYEANLIQEVTLASAALASKRLGALIVIERDMGLKTFCETGIELDARVSYDLLMNIFTRRSPLHDGAVIVADGRIKAASCFLPLTTTAALSHTYGTRHRAAIGITEESDALAIVVSEERGIVSLARQGKIVEQFDAERLEAALRAALSPQPNRKARKKERRQVRVARKETVPPREVVATGGRSLSD